MTSSTTDSSPHGPADMVPTTESAFTQIKGSRKVADNVSTVLIYFCMALALIPLVWVLFELVVRGTPSLLSGEWWTASQRGVPLVHLPVVLLTQSSVPWFRLWLLLS